MNCMIFVFSLIVSTYAPNVDQEMTIHYYVRSKEQDEQLGLLEVRKITISFFYYHPINKDSFSEKHHEECIYKNQCSKYYICAIWFS